MWIIQEPKKVALWNKRHFEEKNGECTACLKYSVLIFVEKIYIKCNIWRVAVCPSYIWDARFLKVNIRSLIYLKIHFSFFWLSSSAIRPLLLPEQKGHLPLPVYFLIFHGFHKLVQITQVSVNNAFRPLADYFLPFTWTTTSVLSCTDFMVLCYSFTVQVNKLYTTAVVWSDLFLRSTFHVDKPCSEQERSVRENGGV